MNTKRLLAGLHFLLITWTISSGSLTQSALAQLYTHPVVICGNKPDWTKVATVHAHTLFRVYADGTVKFGLFSTTDTAVAGVKGNRLFSLIQTAFGPSPRINGTYPSTTFNSSGQPRAVNFNQGGIWIKIADPATGQSVIAPELYYYWDRYLTSSGICFSKTVQVYAKAHDGGRDPESTRDYQDNTGYYRVWLGLTPSSRSQ
jgi:hypothetical protein